MKLFAHFKSTYLSKGYLRNEIKQKSFWLKALFVLLIFAIFLINTIHESYPDEFDNILGGWYILHGRLIYIGFFTHHGPVAYYIAALVELFSGRSFVSFRIWYSLLLCLFTFWSYISLRRRFTRSQLSFYPFFVFIIG